MDPNLEKRTLKKIYSLLGGTDKRWTFSKIMFLLIFILSLGVSIYSCIVMWVFQDLSMLEWLIPAVFAECAVVSGFYSYKSKTENQLKIQTQQMLIRHFLSEQGVDTEGAYEQHEEECCEEEE